MVIMINVSKNNTLQIAVCRVLSIVKSSCCLESCLVYKCFSYILLSSLQTIPCISRLSLNSNLRSHLLSGKDN